jgi:hypothetical protein
VALVANLALLSGMSILVFMTAIASLVGFLARLIFLVTGLTARLFMRPMQWKFSFLIVVKR